METRGTNQSEILDYHSLPNPSPSVRAAIVQQLVRASSSTDSKNVRDVPAEHRRNDGALRSPSSSLSTTVTHRFWTVPAVNPSISSLTRADRVFNVALDF